MDVSVSVADVSETSGTKQGNDVDGRFVLFNYFYTQASWGGLTVQGCFISLLSSVPLKMPWWETRFCQFSCLYYWKNERNVVNTVFCVNIISTAQLPFMYDTSIPSTPEEGVWTGQTGSTGKSTRLLWKYSIWASRMYKQIYRPHIDILYIIRMYCAFIIHLMQITSAVGASGNAFRCGFAIT